jgi:hypothetical protein
MDIEDSGRDARTDDAPKHSQVGPFDELVTGDELMEWCTRQERNELHIMILEQASTNIDKNPERKMWRIRGRFGSVPGGSIKRIQLTPPKKPPGRPLPGSIFTHVKGRYFSSP